MMLLHRATTIGNRHVASRACSGSTLSQPHAILIDGMPVLYRSYYAMPPLEVEGQPVHAALGFTKAILRLAQRWPNATWFAVMFDAPGPTFRMELDPRYKAGRPPMPPDLRTQLQIAHHALDAMDVCSVRMAGLEADDLLATYTHQVLQAGGRTTLVTTDKDMMQLVGPRCEIYNPYLKGQAREIGEQQVEEKFGVPPHLVVQVQALAGDPGDNVPGVKGVGIKTAQKLIREHGSLEAVLSAAAAGQIKGVIGKRLQDPQSVADARTSLRLVQLVQEATVPTSLEELVRRPIARGKLSSWLYEQQFWSVLKPTRHSQYF